MSIYEPMLAIGLRFSIHSLLPNIISFRDCVPGPDHHRNDTFSSSHFLDILGLWPRHTRTVPTEWHLLLLSRRQDRRFRACALQRSFDRAQCLLPQGFILFKPGSLSSHLDYPEKQLYRPALEGWRLSPGLPRRSVFTFMISASERHLRLCKDRVVVDSDLHGAPFDFPRSVLKMRN